MRAVSKYLWVGRTAARSNLAYVAEVAARSVFLVVMLYIFVRLWTVVYAGSATDRLAGLTLSQMLWYLVVTESIIMSSPRVSVEVDEDVRTGRLAVHFLRPLSYPLYRLANALGERVVRFMMNVAIGGAVATVLVGPVHLTIEGLAMLALVLPLAFILDFTALFIVGLGAFWLESTTGILLMYSRINMILGGTLLPLEILPDRLQPVLRALPFAGMIHAPARIFVSPDRNFFAGTLIRQAAALVVLGLAAVLIQRIAVKRIQSNGG